MKKLRNAEKIANMLENLKYTILDLHINRQGDNAYALILLNSMI